MHPKDFASCRVLIVDDDLEFLELVKCLLEDQIKPDLIQTATNGEEGLVHALSGEFDLIVSDTNMPVLHGPGFIKALREQGNKTPVLLLYSNSIQVEKLKESEVLNCGANIILTKNEFAQSYRNLLPLFLRTKK